MIKRTLILASLLAAGPALAQSPIVDVPTSPDHPMAKSVGWVEPAPKSASTLATGNSVPNYKPSQRARTRATRSNSEQVGQTPDRSASQLNQQEIGRLLAAPGVISR